ncbi:hypothetical protein ACPZ19_43755 [Amycolatopsis lurida]
MSYPVPELNLLQAFDDSQAGLFAAWAGLDKFGEMDFLADEPELMRRLIRFASANMSGSLYALWRVDDRADLATLPVVLLGDEGGLHLVAADLREFFRLLGALDEVLGCDEEDVFVVGDEEPMPARGAYLAWLDREFGLAAPEDPFDVIEEAQAKVGQRFATWLHPIMPEAVYSPVHELNALKKFENEPGEDYRFTDPYVDGFWLADGYGESDLELDPQLKAAVIPFAEAGDTAWYALWRPNDRDVAAAPVVRAEEQGGIQVVAKNLREFLQVLAATGNGGPRHRHYVAWLDRTFGLAPADDPDTVVAAANTELGSRLDAWLAARQFSSS